MKGVIYMAIETFNRVEEKYIVTSKVYNLIMKDIENYMDFDEYSKNGKFYQICNIYYDTEDDNLIRTSLQKPKYKEKFRLRSYGIPGYDSKVFLEVKKKYKGVVNKRRTTLTLRESYNFANTNIIPEIKDYMNPQVLKELQYSFNLYQLVPKVFLSYERRAMFGKEDSSFRVTFDRNIISRREDIGLEYGIFGERVIPMDSMIMEVKFGERMPLWFINILRKYDLHKTSFSKYGTEYNKYVRNGKTTDREVRKYA